MPYKSSAFHNKTLSECRYPGEVQQLQELFPSSDPLEIDSALREVNGDLNAAAVRLTQAQPWDTTTSKKRGPKGQHHGRGSRSHRGGRASRASRGRGLAPVESGVHERTESSAPSNVSTLHPPPSSQDPGTFGTEVSVRISKPAECGLSWAQVARPQEKASILSPSDVSTELISLTSESVLVAVNGDSKSEEPTTIDPLPCEETIDAVSEEMRISIPPQTRSQDELSDQAQDTRQDPVLAEPVSSEVQPSSTLTDQPIIALPPKSPAPVQRLSVASQRNPSKSKTSFQAVVMPPSSHTPAPDKMFSMQFGSLGIADDFIDPPVDFAEADSILTKPEDSAERPVSSPPPLSPQAPAVEAAPVPSPARATAEPAPQTVAVPLPDHFSPPPHTQHTPHLPSASQHPSQVHIPTHSFPPVAPQPITLPHITFPPSGLLPSGLPPSGPSGLPPPGLPPSALPPSGLPPSALQHPALQPPTAPQHLAPQSSPATSRSTGSQLSGSQPLPPFPLHRTQHPPPPRSWYPPPPANMFNMRQHPQTAYGGFPEDDYEKLYGNREDNNHPNINSAFTTPGGPVFHPYFTANANPWFKLPHVLEWPQDGNEYKQLLYGNGFMGIGQGNTPPSRPQHTGGTSVEQPYKAYSHNHNGNGKDGSSSHSQGVQNFYNPGQHTGGYDPYYHASWARQ